MNLEQLTDLEAFKEILDRRSAVYAETTESHWIDGEYVDNVSISFTTDDDYTVIFQFKDGDAMNNFNPVVNQ